jgi:hypothetical protein
MVLVSVRGCVDPRSIVWPMKNRTDPNENQTCDPPARSAVPQLSEPLCTLRFHCRFVNSNHFSSSYFTAAWNILSSLIRKLTYKVFGIRMLTNVRYLHFSPLYSVLKYSVICISLICCEYFLCKHVCITISHCSINIAH